MARATVARSPRARSDPDAAYADELRRIGLAAGLEAVGVAAATPWPDAQRRLEERKAAGLHGGMGFTFHKPSRSADPSTALPDAAAIVVGARRYRRRPPASPPVAAGPTGRVASYAWEDHYASLRTSLRVIAERLRHDGWRARVLVDDNAMIDREAAYRAGLGWFGKSANLLLPGQGSWFVLGGVVTSAPLPSTEDANRVPDGCGSCQRCITGCPTGAIVAPGVVDARRCLSWLLQVDGDLPRPYREAVGSRLYGCDASEDATAEVPLLALLAADDAALLGRHGAWFIPRRDPDHLRRNALVALGNSATGTEAGTVAAISRYLAHPNPMLRRHAAWAARRLGRVDLLWACRDDAEVAAELAEPAPPVARAAGAR
jgi:epoxyqueuosine reductase